jgi:hypothetical protein
MLKEIDMSTMYPTIKTSLLLLAILGAYGVVGKMDYDDAVMLEKARKKARYQECTSADSAASQRQPQSSTSGPVTQAPELEKRSSDRCKVLIF